jgi:2-polyprenyl-3-methyl-5-hydroxy-6-metoxy-1,4-benzoquinol methylase
MLKTEALAKFRKLFEQLSYAQDYNSTFNAFLDFALWRLAPYCAEQMKDELNRLNKMFPEKLAPVICEMFDAWSYACDDDGEGFYDALGDLFMDCVSHGRNGQFFTPQPICDMMAELTHGNKLEPEKTVADCACGSGRMLLAMAKKERRLTFFGADNDLTCIKMCVLNMLINCMKGEAAWMNTLSMEHYKSYHVKLQLIGTHWLPFLTITGAGETHFVKKLKESFNSSENNPPQHDKLQTTEKGQILLF